MGKYEYDAKVTRI